MTGERAKILVFCERQDNESLSESVIRELETYYDVRAFGPGWPKRSLSELDLEGVRFYLELDSASGKFCRPEGLERLSVPKFAWLVDTHEKPDFHRAISRGMDLTFYAMKNWGHVLEGRVAWLPLHCDSRIFHPLSREREIDIAFVGSHGWRAEPILKIAAKHGLRAHVECTSGEFEKTKTAEFYARSKLVFNRHVANDLNSRVFEATACGRVLLTDAQWNGQYELFDDEKHFVLYTDETDLEEKVLKYLRDDDARGKIEAAAAEHSARNHTTRVRVAELRRAIETYLGENGGQDRHAASLAPREAVRWLVYAGEQPGSVSGRSYGESLAYALAERGDQVVLARKRRGCLSLGERPARPGEPRVVDLEVGSLEEAKGPNSALGEAAALHAALAELAADLELDGVMAEGPLGALVAQPLAARRSIPFVFAVAECEVVRRKNRLTREQLYWADVEQWGVERARLVLVRGEASSEAVRRHYRARAVVTLDPKVALEPPRDTRRLLGRLGLAGTRYTVLLGRDMSERDVLRLLKDVNEPALLFTDRGVWAKARAVVAVLSRSPATGAVLGALLKGAELVVALDKDDARAEEARTLGCRIHGGPATALETDLRPIDAIFEGQKTKSARPAPEAELLNAVQ